LLCGCQSFIKESYLLGGLICVAVTAGVVALGS